MPRIRSIKPEFWTDEKMAPLTPTDRLVFLGLISNADDAGRLVDSVKMLDGILFSLTDDTSGPSLDELERVGVIERGLTESGQRVIQIVNWSRHQRIEKPNFAAALPPIVTGDEKNANVEAERPPTANSTTSRGVIPGGVDDKSPTHINDLRPTSNDLRSKSSPPDGGSKRMSQSEQFKELCWWIERHTGSRQVWNRKYADTWNTHLGRYGVEVLIGLVADRDFQNAEYAIKAFGMLDEHPKSAYIQSCCRERYWELKKANWADEMESSPLRALLRDAFPEPDSWDPVTELDRIRHEHGVDSPEAKGFERKWNHLLTA